MKIPVLVYHSINNDKYNLSLNISNFENQLAYQALQRGLKGVICGHIHNPEIKTITIKKKKIEYLNCGDWIENNSYIVYKKNKFRLCFISDEI